MKNSSKLIFFSMTIFSTLILFSTSSWFNTWISLEINLISFISFMLIYKTPLSIESSIIYFLMQSLASILFLFSIIMYMNKLNLNFYLNNYLNYMILLSLLMKIGAAPFHFWMPLMIEGISWIPIYMLLTWQKLGPLMLLLNMLNFKLMILFIILSTMMGALGGLNQTSLKKLMSFSSINQISWILMSLNMSIHLLKIYLLTYFYITINILIIFYMLNLNNINQILNFKMKLNYKMFIFMNILSMGGLPPFLGFYPKMMVIMNYNLNFMIMMLIIFTMITLFYYLRLSYSTFMINNMKLNILNNKPKWLKTKLILFFSFMTNIIFMIMLLN